jgi:signal transduction histidine kinase
MLQKQLEQAEKMILIGRLTAGIAHDIKNPLNLMINFADLSLERTKTIQDELQTGSTILNEEKQENISRVLDSLAQNLQKIKEHGKRIDNLVKSMLLQSQGQKGICQPVDLNRLLEENISLVYHSMKNPEQPVDIKMETHLDDSIGNIDIIPQNFSRAFFNIISNACFSVLEKQKKASPDFSPSVSVTSKNLENTIEIRILDNGNGIPYKDKDKLFRPFFTTKPSGIGTGLGLAIAYEIITHEHKGTIVVNSEEGKFAEFIISIPKNGKKLTMSNDILT